MKYLAFALGVLCTIATLALPATAMAVDYEVMLPSPDNIIDISPSARLDLDVLISESACAMPDYSGGGEEGGDDGGDNPGETAAFFDYNIDINAGAGCLSTRLLS